MRVAWICHEGFVGFVERDFCCFFFTGVLLIVSWGLVGFILRISLVLS